MKKVFIFLFLLISFNLFAQNINPELIVTTTSDSLHHYFVDGEYTIKFKTSLYHPLLNSEDYFIFNNSSDNVPVFVKKNNKIVTIFDCGYDCFQFLPEYNRLYCLFKQDDDYYLNYYDYKANKKVLVLDNGKSINVYGNQIYLSEDRKSLYFIQYDPEDSFDKYLTIYNIDEDKIENQYSVFQNNINKYLAFTKITDNLFCFTYKDEFDNCTLQLYKIENNSLCRIESYYLSEYSNESSYDCYEMESISLLDGSTNLYIKNELNSDTIAVSFQNESIINNSDKIQGTLFNSIYYNDTAYLVTVEFAKYYGIIRVYDKNLNLILENQNEYGSIDNDYHIEDIGFNDDGNIVVLYKLNDKY